MYTNFVTLCLDVRVMYPKVVTYDGLPQSIRDPGSPYSLLFSIAPLYIPSSVIKPVSSIISSLGMKSKGSPRKLVSPWIKLTFV